MTFTQLIDATYYIVFNTMPCVDPLTEAEFLLLSDDEQFVYLSRGTRHFSNIQDWVIDFCLVRHPNVEDFGDSGELLSRIRSVVLTKVEEDTIEAGELLIGQHERGLTAEQIETKKIRVKLLKVVYNVLALWRKWCHPDVVKAESDAKKQKVELEKKARSEVRKVALASSKAASVSTSEEGTSKESGSTSKSSGEDRSIPGSVGGYSMISSISSMSGSKRKAGMETDKHDEDAAGDNEEIGTVHSSIRSRNETPNSQDEEFLALSQVFYKLHSTRTHLYQF
jgi:hypothetical protein